MGSLEKIIEHNPPNQRNGPTSRYVDTTKEGKEGDGTLGGKSAFEQRLGKRHDASAQVWMGLDCY
jgi:hypothetical protein